MKALIPLTVCLSFITYCIPASTDEVTIVADRWYPYNGIPNSPQPGYGIEIARYGLSLGNHTLKYQLMSWEKALKQVSAGKKDCVIGAYKYEARDFVYPDQPIGIDQIIFIKRKDSPWYYHSVENLHEIRLGTIPGYEYSHEVSDYIKNHAKPGSVSNTRGKYALEFNLSALLKGELDAVVDSKIVLKATLHKHGWDKEVAHAGNANAESGVYIGCTPGSKNSEEYTQLISKGISQLRESGELEKILQKYNLEDWYPQVNGNNFR